MSTMWIYEVMYTTDEFNQINIDVHTVSSANKYNNIFQIIIYSSHINKILIITYPNNNDKVL